METTQNENLVTMSSFIQAGGMKTLLHYATHVTATPVMLDPRNAENYFVDIRFRFNTKAGRPYFGETGCGMDAVVIPRKLVSKLSDEPTSTEPTSTEPNSTEPNSTEPNSTELTVFSGGNVETVSEGRLGMQGEAVYMPDVCWIARTAALSSILKQEAKDQAEETAEEDGRSVATITTVTSVRGAVRALEADEHGAEPDIDREFCFDVPAGPAKLITDEPVEKATPAHEVADHDPSEDLTLNQVRDQGVVHSSDRITKKEREDNVGSGQAASVNARNADSGEMPAGCGLLRSSSLKAAVKTIRRSFSRERLGNTSEKSGNIGSRQASGASTSAVEQPRKKCRDNYDDPELLLIQPNIQPPRNPPTNFEDTEVQPPQGPPLQRVVPEEVPTTPPMGGVEDRPDREVERDETVARGLFRRTSNLAVNIIRKLSSNDKRAARQASGEGNADPNNLDRFAKRRSWLGRRQSADDIGRRPGMVIPEASIESTQEPYRVHKRRSLIFGRRYKN